MKIKRMIALVLAMVLIISNMPLSAFASILAVDPTTATEEELERHRTELFDVADQAGFAKEYELFYAVLESMDEKGVFWAYDDFAAYCKGLSDEVLLKLLGFLRKFVAAGQVSGYSEVSATEEFFQYEMQNIYYTYLVPGGNGNRVTAQDLAQFENTSVFPQQLPESFYFANPEDVPDELVLTLEVSPAVLAAGDDITWVIAKTNHYPEQLLTEYEPDTQVLGNRLTLKLSADEILSCAANTSPWGKDEGGYNGFYVRVYVNGYLSEPCYIAVGTDAFLQGSSSYWGKENDYLTVDFNTDRLPKETAISYEWRLSRAGMVPDYILEGTYDDTTWETLYTSEPVLAKETVIEALGEEWWDDLYFMACNISWEVFGETHSLCTPIMAVFGAEDGVRELDDPDWTFEPISVFEVFKDGGYLEPGTVINSNVFTLSDNTTLDCHVYHRRDDNYYDRTYISRQGTTFTVPAASNEHYSQETIFVEYFATAPDGTVYEGMSRSFKPYPEGVLVYVDSGRSDQICDESALHKYVPVSNKNTTIFNAGNISLYYNGVLYTTDAYYASKRLKVDWYTNTVKSYEGATKHSSNTISFNAAPDTLGEHYIYCVVYASDFSYTSDIFTYTVIDPTALTENLYSITDDGMLYQVFSSDEKVVIPETINGITVKSIGGSAFGTDYYGKDRCPNMTELILPDTVERLYSSSIPRSLTYVDIGDGIKYLDHNWGEVPELTITDTMEKIWFSNVETLNVESVEALDKLSQFVEYYLYGSLSVGKLVLPEGLEIIGQGGLDYELWVDELVLPTTLRVFKPVKPVYVGTSMVLPENLEVFDAGVNIDEWGYISMNFEYGGDTLVFPENLTTLGYLGKLYNMTQPPLPEGVMPGEFAFFGSAIESYTVPADMTVIPRYLFAQSSLTEIVIPDGVTEIGEGAFADCGNLERIVIPASVTKIGKNAFQNCYSLREVIIEGVVESIGAYAFQDCGSLETIEIQDGLKRIEDGVFTGCYGITSLDFLPDSVSYIGNNAFRYSGLMGHITLPEGVLSIGYNVFEGTGMESIQLNERLLDIGDKAFYGTYITEITIPDSVVRIGRRAFMYVPLEKVTFGENVEFIGAYAFYGTYLTAFQIPAKLTKLLAGVIADTQITEINLNAEGIGTITYVGPFAFSDTGIQRIVFPETVTYIGRGVCWNCWNLETVALPSQISVIRDRSFAGCDALLSVQITAPLERVDEMAFAYCSQLNGITLPDSLRIVGNRAFMECYSLEIEKLPASLIYIEDFAFNGTKLQIAELGEKVIYVGKGAFKDCVELQSVVLNEGLLTIEASAFEGCVLLTELEIPDTVEKVGDYFINGTAIEIIELPDGLRFIPYFAGNTVIREVICPSNQIQFLWAKTFEGCTSLEIADVYSGERIGYDCFKGCVSLKYFHAYYKTTFIGDSAFEGCAAMQLITFGGEDSQLETIGEKAFSGCVGITELKLPKTLRTIGSRAFERTSITSIIVPSLVQSIGTGPIYTEMGVLSGYGDSCFYDCPELQKIVFVDRDGAFLPIYSFAEYCPKLAEVYLPSSVGWMCCYNGFDDSYFDRVNEFDYTNYYQAMLPGYVPTKYYRYGVYDQDKDWDEEEYSYCSIYKPGDTVYVRPFSDDYTQWVDYLEYLYEKAAEYQEAGLGQLNFPTKEEYIKPLTELNNFGITVMAGEEDISDKVQINWYVNWLEDNVLTTGALLNGSAWICDTFRYRFTVTLDESYAFDYMDYASEEFVLQSTMEGQRIVINLQKRDKGTVEINQPENLKNDPTMRVVVYQTQSNLLRELETQVIDGKITLQVAPSANLLVYAFCDGYYKFTGAVDSMEIQNAIDTDSAHVLDITMTALPKSGTFSAKFNIHDILPEGEITAAMLESFDGISVEIRNETQGTVCTNYVLQYPYIIIKDYETFFELSDLLTVTVTPDASLEMYGFTAVLNPGNQEEYGTTEGTLAKYGALYITPMLPKESKSKKAVVQVFNVLGDRCSIDVVDSGELLIRCFADGKYTVTVSEQNYFLNAVDRLLQFTSCGWTAGEDYHKETVELTAPCCKELAMDVPLAPEASFLMKEKPTARKEYKVFSQWWNYNWPYYTTVEFDITLDTQYNLQNTQLVLSFPADLEMFHISIKGREPGHQMTYDRKYYSDDGQTVYYEYPLNDLAQLGGRVQLYLCLRYQDDVISYEQIKDQYCVATILTDATVDGVVGRHYVPAGSVSMMDDQMLSSMVNVEHSPTVSKRKNIAASVTAPAGSEIELYADGVLVAQGKANYTGLAVMRYDVPFDWIWWEYEVYAVVRIGNSDFTYTTEPVSVEFNEDLASPVEIVGTVEIVDDETKALVYPNVYDTENRISVNFQTGDRTNIKMQSVLDDTEGKTYTVYETFRVKFDRSNEAGNRNVAIVIRYTDEFGNEKEEYLWADYDAESDSFIAEKTISHVTYDPAKLLQALQLPTHMGVEWDTSVNTLGIVLMPGQIQALAEKLNDAYEHPFVSMFGTELTLADVLDVMKDPVTTNPLFPYLPAQMQADMLSDYQVVMETQSLYSHVFTKAFGFRITDMSTEDYLTLVSAGKSGTIDENVTAAELLAEGYIEIPVYGQDAGVFMFSGENRFEVYDFSSNCHMVYDATSWMEVIQSYMPKQPVMMYATRPLSEGEENSESLSKYVAGINDQYVADVIDRTYEQYKSMEEFFDSAFIEGINDAIEYIAEYYDESWTSYMFGVNNPVLNSMTEAAAKALSWAKDLPGLNTLDWDWDQDRLINQYLNADGLPCAELTPEGQQMLADSNLTSLSYVLTELTGLGIETVAPIFGEMLDKQVGPYLYKEYLGSHFLQQNLLRVYYQEVGIQSMNGIKLGMSGANYNAMSEELGLQNLVDQGMLKLTKTYDVNDPNNLIAVQLESNVKGLNAEQVYYLSSKIDNNNVIYQAIQAKNNFQKFFQTKPGKVASGISKIFTFVTGAGDLTIQLNKTANAIDKMCAQYSEYVEQMLGFGVMYARIDEMCDAMLAGDKEKMEYFTVLPLYEPYMADDFTGLIWETMQIPMFKTVILEEYGSEEVFNMLFEGQAYMWKAYYYTIGDPAADDFETDIAFYKKDTWIETFGDLVGSEYMENYFSDTKQYYFYEFYSGLNYGGTVRELRSAVVDAMLDLSRLCTQYNTEIMLETVRMTNSLATLIPFGPGDLYAYIMNTAVELPLVFLMDMHGEVYENIYSKENTIKYEFAVDKIRQAYENYQTTKELIEFRGEDGKGNWFENGKKYVSRRRADELWDAMAEKYWYYFEWYPSGYEDGERWDQGKMEFDEETDYDTGDMIFSEDDMLMDLIIEQEEYPMMECSDPLIDPAGFIYEAVLSNRVEGATVSIYYEDENGNPVLWDAENYGQTSTILTEAGGYYSWLTPPGNWKVVAQKDGYLMADTTNDKNAVDGWLPVPPPQLDINIGLVTTLVPEIVDVNGYTEGVLVQFGQYMDIDSFDGAVTLTVDDENVPCVLTFTDREVSATDAEVYYGRKLMVSRMDGEPLTGTVQVTVNGSVKNYAGLALGATFVSDELEIQQYVTQIETTYDFVVVKTAERVTLEGRLLDTYGNPVAGRRIVLASDARHIQLLNEIVYTDRNGYFTFSVEGTDVGFTVVEIHPEDAGVSAAITVQTQRATAKNQYETTKSDMPTVVVVGPDGKYGTVEITESGILTVSAGSKLLVTGMSLGQIGYSSAEGSEDPWKCEDYTIYEQPITAEEKTYRIVRQEEGKIYSDVLELTVVLDASHVHNLTLVAAEDPTCTEAGHTAYYTCSGCAEWFADASGAVVITDKTSVVVGALDHSFTHYVSDGNATCTEDGTKTAKCDRCDATDTIADTGSALNHSFTHYVSDGNATCTADGTKTAKCDRCDATDTITDVGSALDHDYSTQWSYGEETHWHECICGDKIDETTHDYGTGDTCVECGYERSHVHRLTLVPAEDPTCTEAGHTAYYTCSGCAEWFADASGAVVITDKTSVVIEALGHDLTDATCTDAAKCQRAGCGHVEEALGHKDENLDGACDVCGNKLDSPVPPTGDHSYVMIIVLLVSVTAAGIILIALPRRRRNSAR